MKICILHTKKEQKKLTRWDKELLEIFALLMLEVLMFKILIVKPQQTEVINITVVIELTSFNIDFGKELFSVST